MELVAIEDIKGVGVKTKEIFHKYQIRSTKDLVLYYPRKYEQYQLQQLTRNNHNQIITVKFKITSEISILKFSKINASTFLGNNNNKQIKVIAFRREYLAKSFNIGDIVIVHGKYNYYKSEITANKVTSESSYLAIKPVYNIEGLLDINITKIIMEIFNNSPVSLLENIPLELTRSHKLKSRAEAIKLLHLAPNNMNLDQALRRMKYEEAYFFQKDLISRVNKEKLRSPIEYDLDKVQSLIEQLPYNLTNDQKAAVNDVFRDFKKSAVTYRLIQGDVGSGKTIVAALAIYGAITAGLQVALMAPTEMLAKQHYDYFIHLFGNEIKTAMLTSQTSNKVILKNDLTSHKIDLLIGTQAIIEDDVVFNKLGLIVVDEQHKFGVRTRNTLTKKALTADLIYLTATPIPRTLAISLFNEAEISVIKEKPKNRVVVKTKYITDTNKVILYNEIKETLSRNEKTYVVVPAITSDHAKYNIDIVYRELSARFNKENIFILHGKLNGNEKVEVMKSFINAKTGILLATTMIEVGIDIKDATLMIIYGADYFGLSQLHQLRGRVGRSNLPSTCLLISSSDDVSRLELLTKIDDGFKLSKYDLKQRGPGALIGFEQTGFPKFIHLDFIKDYNILKTARFDLMKMLKK